MDFYQRPDPMSTPKEDRWSQHCKQQIITLLENSDDFNDADVNGNVESFVFEMIHEDDNTPEDLSEILSDISARIGPDAYHLLSDIQTKLSQYFGSLKDRTDAIVIQGPANVGHTASVTVQPYHQDYPDRFLKK